MGITVIHNPTSGFEQLSKEELLGQLRAQGYAPVYRASKSDDLSHALQKPGGLVVVAGGDGTVGKVAKHLIGRDIPINVLPLGTANNVARTLASFGCDGRPASASALSSVKHYDIGLAKSDEDETAFLESAGLGLFVDLMSIMMSDEHTKERAPSNREEELRHNLKTLKNALSEYRARDYQVKLDREDYSGQYLSVEVMNIRSIGPNVELAPRADPGDGRFDVVFISEDDREDLDVYLANRLKGKAATLDLTVRKAQRVTLSSPDELKLHIDDEIISLDRSASCEICLKSDMLRFV